MLTFMISQGAAGHPLFPEQPTEMDCLKSFHCVPPATRIRAAVGEFWPPSRRGFCPKYQKTSRGPGLCKAASVARWTKRAHLLGALAPVSRIVE